MKTFRSVAFLLAFGFLFNITASQATSRLDQSSSQHATSVFTTDERRNLGVDEEKSPQKSVPVASGLLSGIIGTYVTISRLFSSCSIPANTHYLLQHPFWSDSWYDFGFWSFLCSRQDGRLLGRHCSSCGRDFLGGSRKGEGN